MDKSVASRIAKRFITLPLDKRKLYLEKMSEEGVSVANLPIPRVVDAFSRIPLSYAQERQWFLWQLEPDSAAYNIPTALRLRGELDVPALRRSFAALVARHDVLRTRFVDQGEGLAQVIDPDTALDLPLDLLPDGLARRRAIPGSNITSTSTARHCSTWPPATCCGCVCCAWMRRTTYW